MAETLLGPGRARIVGAIAIAVVGISCSGVLIRGLALTGVPLLAVAFYRMLFASALLGAAALVRRPPAPSRSDARLLVFSGVCLAAHFALWTMSFAYVPVARSVLVVQSQPIFVVLASALFLKEYPSRRVLLGVAIAMLGIVIVSTEGLSGGGDAWRGDVLSLGGAAAVVGYLLAGRKARARLGLLGYVVPVYSVCSLVLLAWCIAAGDRLTGFPPRAWIGFLLLALLPTLLGHTIFNWVIRYVPADTVSVILLAEPVGAAVLAWIFFGESPSMLTFAGAPFILGGIALASIVATPKNAVPEPASE